ncbi:hypothetical protein F5Y19DRAFT_487872 [Xylariaceae sp. FL1651]|nr:hypothetical protein F5Y19DRAFT_487872 [Xylariaceae sp. FL1651]
MSYTPTQTSVAGTASSSSGLPPTTSDAAISKTKGPAHADECLEMSDDSPATPKEFAKIWESHMLPAIVAILEAAFSRETQYTISVTREKRPDFRNILVMTQGPLTPEVEEMIRRVIDDHLRKWLRERTYVTFCLGEVQWLSDKSERGSKE